MVNQGPREHGTARDERPVDDAQLHLDEHVVRLLAAAAAPTEPGPQPGEQLALAAFRESHRSRRLSMFSHPTRAKAAVAATIGAGTFLFAGVGAAAAGVLPDQAQDAASSALAAIGFDVPRANEHAGDHPSQRGEDETTEDATEDTDTTEVETDAVDTEETGDPADPEANDHGQAVSGLAQDDSLEGADKGAAVSELASSKNQSGEDHGKPADAGSQADAHQSTAGTDDADETTDDSTDDTTTEEDGDSADGAATADEKSGGRSSAHR